MLLSILCIPAISSGQVINDNKLSRIPPQLRERFVERLNPYFELKRAKQYDKLYLLLSDAYSGVTKEKPGREEYIKNFQQLDAQDRIVVPLKWKLTKIIKTLDDRGNETYFIYLDLKARYSGRRIDDKAYFEARVEKGDWYFREYYVHL